MNNSVGVGNNFNEKLLLIWNLWLMMLLRVDFNFGLSILKLNVYKNSIVKVSIIVREILVIFKNRCFVILFFFILLWRMDIIILCGYVYFLEFFIIFYLKFILFFVVRKFIDELSDKCVCFCNEFVLYFLDIIVF